MQGGILDELVEARLEQSAPELLQWFGPKRRRESLREFLHGEVERLESTDMASLFARHCPVPGAVAADYRNKLVELPGFDLALVGIRFWALDLARPFVTIVASARLPRSQKHISAQPRSSATCTHYLPPGS